MDAEDDDCWAEIPASEEVSGLIILPFGTWPSDKFWLSEYSDICKTERSRHKSYKGQRIENNRFLLSIKIKVRKKFYAKKLCYLFSRGSGESG